jgi:tetratricopeptide (TPR) repeat protein
MKWTYGNLRALGLAGAFITLSGINSAGTQEELMARYRNLGKAFYENPTTQLQAVGEFKKALDLAPNSVREHINYGLALMRAGKTAEGAAELEKAQKMDPSIPHTWFNLGIEYKRESQYDRAIEQFEQMVKLVPEEPISHYNLGVLYKLTGKPDDAVRQFEISAKLNPNLAGPHFQLYNTYRASGKQQEANSELAVFQRLKKSQEGAAVPEDLDWSYYAEIFETIEPRAEDQPPRRLTFEDRVLAARMDGRSAGLAVVDADGDGRPDLLAWDANGVRLFKNGEVGVESCGLEEQKGVVSLAPGDFNNDGYDDLCVVTAFGASLYINEKGTFRKSPLQLPAGRFAKAVWLDYDHDYDLDLFLLGERSALVRNNGTAGFGDISASFPFVPGKALSATPLDLIADTSGADLVVSYQDHAGVLYRDRLMGRYDAVTLDALPAGASSVSAYDFNNDGWTDLAASGPKGIVLAANRGGRLEALSAPESSGGPLTFADLENRAVGDLIAGGVIFRNQGLGRLTLKCACGFPGAAAVAAADFDHDGRSDVAYIAADGSLHLARNSTPTANHWLGLSLTGVKNLKLASGSKVEVKAGGAYQKKTYSGTPLLFGLQSHKEVDTVRITWPNGLIQNQPNEAAGRYAVFREAQRLSGSCPMIFTWNGSKFEFITDVLGVAPLGASSGDGSYFPVDHDEYIQIPGESLVPVDGQYPIRITEELHEVSYLDRVGLMAVDHPDHVDIYTNEKFKGPPFPEFRLFGVRQRHYPVSAREDRGRDVLSRVLKRDRTYPDGFPHNYAGVASRHTLELDFGRVPADNRAVLILNGWVDWADGSTFLGATQEKESGLVFPYLQVKDPAGRWKTVIADMGIPAGKPKTIAVDLTGKFLSSSREIRIVTNLCVYWDEIFLSEETEPPAVSISHLDADSAELRFRGFSQPRIDPQRRQPEAFDYSSWMPVSMWNPTPGKYTRYGDVLPLLGAADDRMVIMGSGDEVRLLFPARNLPPLRDGWRRDYLLYVDGWAKDGDANTAFSQSVEPLPFHGMTRYPYSAGERYPNDNIHRLYLQQYNTRPALRLIRSLVEQATR